MPDGQPNPVPLDFDKLTKNQQRLVRKLTWERLKVEAQFIVVVPWVLGSLGAFVGIVAGVLLSRLIFFSHLFRCSVVCVSVGTGVGIWIARSWLEKEFRPHFKSIIQDHEREISEIN